MKRKTMLFDDLPYEIKSHIMYLAFSNTWVPWSPTILLLNKSWNNWAKNLQNVTNWYTCIGWQLH